MDAAADYARRIRPYARLEIEEVAESRIREGASEAKEKKATQVERRAIMERLRA